MCPLQVIVLTKVWMIETPFSKIKKYFLSMHFFKSLATFMSAPMKSKVGGVELMMPEERGRSPLMVRQELDK